MTVEYARKLLNMQYCSEMANLPDQNAWYIILHTPSPSNISHSNVLQIVVLTCSIQGWFHFVLFSWLSIIVFSFDSGAGGPGTDFSWSRINASLTSCIVDPEPHYISKINVYSISILSIIMVYFVCVLQVHYIYYKKTYLKASPFVIYIQTKNNSQPLGCFTIIS